jgi:hypothetical protein
MMALPIYVEGWHLFEIHVMTTANASHPSHQPAHQYFKKGANIVNMVKTEKGQVVGLTLHRHKVVVVR